MNVDEIIRVEIDRQGRLCVTPRSGDFDLVYRAAMEVYWDRERKCLHSPIPREWTYPMWFRQIVAAVADEFGVRLSLSGETLWVNVPDALRAEMVGTGTAR